MGFWKNTDELVSNWNEDKRWEPVLDETARAKGYRNWKKAVDRTLNWVEFED